MLAREQLATSSMNEQESRSELERRQASLYLRLEDGYARIEQAIVEGNDIRRWEDLWMHLLDEYERISDDLRQTA